MKSKIISFLFVCSFVPLALGADDKKADGWGHESELAVAAAYGNTDTQTYRAKQVTAYTFDSNVVKLGGHYLYGLSGAAETAKNWDLSLRYERMITEHLSGFLGNAWEGDIFIGYDYRTNADGGAKYYLIPGDKKVDYLVTELGYRFQYEHHVSGVVPPSQTAHFIRAYFEGVIALTSNTTAKAWIELLPDVSDGNNFQSNFEGSLSVALNEMFSLKVGYLGKYRNEVLGAGKKKYDSLVTGALIAKF